MTNYKIKTKEDLPKGLKIKVYSVEESRKIQERLFELGYSWHISSGKVAKYTGAAYLFANICAARGNLGYSSCASFFEGDCTPEYTIDQLFEEDTPAFKVGDKVRIKPFVLENRPSYIDDMLEYINKLGTVDYISGNKTADVPYRVLLNNHMKFWFSLEDLELITAEDKPLVYDVTKDPEAIGSFEPYMGGWGVAQSTYNLIPEGLELGFREKTSDGNIKLTQLCAKYLNNLQPTEEYNYTKYSRVTLKDHNGRDAGAKNVKFFNNEENIKENDLLTLTETPEPCKLNTIQIPKPDDCVECIKGASTILGIERVEIKLDLTKEKEENIMFNYNAETITTTTHLFGVNVEYLSPKDFENAMEHLKGQIKTVKETIQEYKNLDLGDDVSHLEDRQKELREQFKTVVEYYKKSLEDNE